MEYDLLIVGAGPAGLAAAIRFKKLCQYFEQDFSVCILEKGSEVGAHILSGAVLDPKALDELIPNWRDICSAEFTPVTKDDFFYLSENKKYSLPKLKTLRNDENVIISLSNLTRWLADYAQSLGVEIYPGFAASEILFDERRHVVGVKVGEVGKNFDGSIDASYTEAVDIFARHTFFAEGCRGFLSEQLIKKFSLRRNSQPQTYGIGIKELWRVDSEQYTPGLVEHCVGFPLDKNTYGGGFCYHMDNNLVSIGLVIGLDYQDPYLNPFQEMQKMKTHPHFAKLLENGKRLQYGARALNEGGYQSIPDLSVYGASLIGCSAGFVNVGKIKGIHNAMKSGMIAAEELLSSLCVGKVHDKLVDFKESVDESWIGKELYQVRNIRPSFSKGLWRGLFSSGIDQIIFRGKAPWTLSHPHEDHKVLKEKAVVKEKKYDAPDNLLTFDLMSSVYLSGVHHREGEIGHIHLKDKDIPIVHNLDCYDAPEQRYCPAGVYEILKRDNGEHYLQINSQNCIHCKTCDIKDPKQNIVWKVPEGGGGPNYSGM